MPRKSPSAADLGIQSEKITREKTVAMPKGGFKNARVIKRTMTMPKVNIGNDEPRPLPAKKSRKR